MNILGKIKPVVKSNFNVFEKVTPVLLVATVALAFVVGILWERVNALEGKGTKVSGQNTQDAAGAAAAPGPINGKLTEDQAKKVPKVSDADHIRGSKDAQIIIIEYSDLECPFCKQFHPTLEQAFNEYKGKVAWVYRHFPLSFHVNAEKEAEASECANELGGNDAFWKYADKIFERTTSNGTGFALDKLVPLAGEIGLNQGKFKECLDSGKYAKHVKEDMDAGTTAGVTGTPGSFVVNKKGEAWIVPGAVAYDTLKATIDEALK